MPDDNAVQLNLDEQLIASTYEEEDDDQSPKDETDHGSNSQHN